MWYNKLIKQKLIKRWYLEWAKKQNLDNIVNSLDAGHALSDLALADLIEIANDKQLANEKLNECKDQLNDLTKEIRNMNDKIVKLSDQMELLGYLLK